MLEQIRNSAGFRAVHLLLLAGAACALASCATKEEPQLVDTGGGPESSLPWNKQERWEGTGQFGRLAEQMDRR